MRASELMTVQVKADDSNPDFGNKTLPWEPLCEVWATIVPQRGRLIQTGNQMQPLYDEMITINYAPEVHEAWQKKKVLRLVDVVGDTYGVKSMKDRRDERPRQLMMGCIRS